MRQRANDCRRGGEPVVEPLYPFRTPASKLWALNDQSYGGGPWISAPARVWDCWSGAWASSFLSSFLILPSRAATPFQSLLSKESETQIPTAPGKLGQDTLSSLVLDAEFGTSTPRRLGFLMCTGVVPLSLRLKASSKIHRLLSVCLYA